MKIPFSPSTTTTTPVSSSLDTNLNNNNVTTKCFSSIVRRFLCSSNLRTHPFDSSIKKIDPVVEFVDQKADENIIQAPATPGIVARLMGLDSMPNKGMSTTHPNSIGRSRSVNSMDCRLESDKTHGGGGGGHRRAKSSLSFRERPTFLELENDEFLLLSFENVSPEFGGSKGRKLSEMGSGELKQKKENGCENRGSKGGQRVFDQNKDDHKRSNKRNCGKYKQHERKISSKPLRKDVERLESASPSPKKRVSNPKDRLNSRKLNEVYDGSKLDKKNNRPSLKKVESECNLENSSPVSVLDIDDFEFEQGSNSSEDESRKTGLNLISKLTPGDVVLNSDRPSIHFTRISIGEVPELRTIESQSTTSGSTKGIDTCTEDYIQLWGEVCKLTEQDMKTSNWMPREMLKMKELDEIGTGFGLEILNQLLHEMAVELEQFSKMMTMTENLACNSKLKNKQIKQQCEYNGVNSNKVSCMK